MKIIPFYLERPITYSTFAVRKAGIMYLLFITIGIWSI